MHCREIVFTPRCSPRARVFPGPRSVSFSVRSTVAELRSKLPNFRILAYFPHTKTVKRPLQWPAYSPGVTSLNDSDFTAWLSKVHKGRRHRRFPATSGREAGDPQTCPKFRLWQMAIPSWQEVGLREIVHVHDDCQMLQSGTQIRQRYPTVRWYMEWPDCSNWDVCIC